MTVAAREHGQRRREVDRVVASLVGRTLLAVRYFELDAYATGRPAWDRDPSYDSVDFGVELEVSVEDHYWVHWSSEFYTYALAVDQNAADDRSDMRVWDVSHVSRWRDCLGVLITAAELTWDWQSLGAGPRVWGPQHLMLRFEDQSTVYLSALTLEPGHAPFGHANNVTVFFSVDAARAAGAFGSSDTTER